MNSSLHRPSALSRATLLLAGVKENRTAGLATKHHLAHKVLHLFASRHPLPHSIVRRLSSLRTFNTDSTTQIPRLVCCTSTLRIVILGHDLCPIPTYGKQPTRHLLTHSHQNTQYMVCPFLDKLPAELHKQIYEDVLDFNNEQLQHVTQLQPFIKKLTGTDGRLPFGIEYTPPIRSAAVFAGRPCKNPFTPRAPVTCAILCASKFIYIEAIRVFYEKNVIRVDLELFKLAEIANVTSPTGSDLSLARCLVVTLNNPLEDPVKPFTQRTRLT